jgi:RNA polymerase sigma factor (sigma-70 family)
MDSTAYSAMLDEELAQLSKEKAPGAFSELLMRHNSRISAFARQIFRGMGDEWEDAAQEGAIALYQAALHYNPHIGVPFEAFSALVVKRKLLTFRRKQGRWWSCASHWTMEEAEACMPAEWHSQPFDAMLEAMELEDVKRAAREKLSGAQSRIVLPYLEGERPKEIAQRLGVSAKTVYNTLSRSRAVIRSAAQSRRL